LTAKKLNNNCPSVRQVRAEEAPDCVDNVWDYGPKYIFVAPRVTPKPSILPESTLVGFPLDCGAQAPSGGGRQTAPCAPGRGGQPPTPPTWVPGGPTRVCAWCGTRFKKYLCGPPGHPKTVHIARVNSCRFSIGLWCTSTSRGGSSDGAWRSREGRSAAHTIFLCAGGAPPRVCVVWDAFQEISLWPPGPPQNRPYCQSQLL